MSHSPLHAHTPRAPPTARYSAWGSHACAAGEPRPAGGGGATSVCELRPLPGHAGGAARVVPMRGRGLQDPVPTLEMAPELLGVDLSCESKSYMYTLAPPATLLPMFKGRMLRFSYECDEGDVQQRRCVPAHPYNPTATTTKTRTRASTARMRSATAGGLLLSGDDLEFAIRGLAPASGELSGLHPARMQTGTTTGLRAHVQ
ncbi:hypothetical protein C8R44DRAFT_893606 [Mycena epipterygia]|nr:hypothetical protein C8R44DRAFT_893606 [Mycena epipterygia]